jgi:hypothetical protein
MLDLPPYSADQPLVDATVAKHILGQVGFLDKPGVQHQIRETRETRC